MQHDRPLMLSVPDAGNDLSPEEARRELYEIQLEACERSLEIIGLPDADRGHLLRSRGQYLRLLQRGHLQVAPPRSPQARRSA